MKHAILLVLSLALAASACNAQEPIPAPREREPNPQTENEWAAFIRDKHYPEGHLESRLFDGTRVDILTRFKAIEVDWADKSHPTKWAEGIGQAAYYAQITGRRGALLLLAPDLTEAQPYVYRAIIAGRLAQVQVLVYDLKNRKFANMKGTPER